MIQKYIIEKTDIHDLLTGQEISLSQGKARAFCVEIVGKITNGDVIKAMFPNASIHYHKADELVDDYVSVNIMGCDTQQDYSAEWWGAPYKAESEE